MSELKLGELLLNSKAISPEQREKALEIKEINPSVPIGQILCKLGFITEEGLHDFLDYYRKREQLGAVLIRRKLLTRQKLDAALELSEKEHIMLGKALLKLRFISEKDLARAIAAQFDLPFVELDRFIINSDLSSYINQAYAKRNQIVPVEQNLQHLTMAVSIPLPRDEIKQVEHFLNMRIKQVIATDNDIALAQQKVYRSARNSPDYDGMLFDLIEDTSKETTRSRYVNDVISTDVESLVKKVISIGISANASDIHLEPTEFGMTIRYRIDGALQERAIGTDAAFLSTHSRQIISRIKILCDMDISERRRPQDSSFKINTSKGGNTRSIDFRVSTIPTLYGESLVMRILDKKETSLTLESLGYFPEMINDMYRTMAKPTGIFLVTGPTGSGKSSTLFAILSHINTPETKTLTVEDPIEYTIDGISQSEVNEIIGNSFARILRSFLRQDPDNIMIGEIRDAETASIAIRAALTGHTVFSTLHTNDATSAVTRLLDMGIEGNLLAATLRGVIAQRLVRKNCEHCLESYQPDARVMEEFAVPGDLSITFSRGNGCDHCHYTGFSGRLPVAEMWLPTKEELLLFTQKPDNILLRQRVFGDTKRTTLVEDGLRRVLRKETPLEELLKVVPPEQISEAKTTMNWQRLAKLAATTR